MLTRCVVIKQSILWYLLCSLLAQNDRHFRSHVQITVYKGLLYCWSTKMGYKSTRNKKFESQCNFGQWYNRYVIIVIWMGTYRIICFSTPSERFKYAWSVPLSALLGHLSDLLGPSQPSQTVSQPSWQKQIANISVDPLLYLNVPPCPGHHSQSDRRQNESISWQLKYWHNIIQYHQLQYWHNTIPYHTIEILAQYIQYLTTEILAQYRWMHWGITVLG